MTACSPQYTARLVVSQSSASSWVSEREGSRRSQPFNTVWGKGRRAAGATGRTSACHLSSLIVCLAARRHPRCLRYVSGAWPACLSAPPRTNTRAARVWSPRVVASLWLDAIPWARSLARVWGVTASIDMSQGAAPVWSACGARGEPVCTKVTASAYLGRFPVPWHARDS